MSEREHGFIKHGVALLFLLLTLLLTWFLMIVGGDVVVIWFDDSWGRCGGDVMIVGGEVANLDHKCDLAKFCNNVPQRYICYS